LGERRIVEISDENNSTYSKNKDPNKRAIHIHGGMEHNLAKYAKYYSYRSKEILGSSKFTRKIDYDRRDVFGHW
jgi:hypothetical protein